jgi:CRISPR-associated endonuclease/helicase Cas3
MGIYVDLVTLEATRRLIEQYSLWEIPKMNRFLVENATHPEAHQNLLEELSPAWRTYENKLFGTETAKAQQANFICLDPTGVFGDLEFPSDEESIRTRLGVEGITVEFNAPVTGPFGGQISRLILPEHWSRGLNSEEEPKDITEEDGDLCFSFSGQRFSYGRIGLQIGKASDA